METQATGQPSFGNLLLSLWFFYLLLQCLHFLFALNPSRAPYPAYFPTLTLCCCSSPRAAAGMPKQPEGFSRPFSPAGPCHRSSLCCRDAPRRRQIKGSSPSECTADVKAISYCGSSSPAAMGLRHPFSNTGQDQKIK